MTKALLEGNDEDIGDVGDLLYRITSLRRDLSVISDLTVSLLPLVPPISTTKPANAKPGLGAIMRQEEAAPKQGRFTD